MTLDEAKNKILGGAQRWAEAGIDESGAAARCQSLRWAFDILDQVEPDEGWISVEDRLPDAREGDTWGSSPTMYEVWFKTVGSERAQRTSYGWYSGGVIDEGEEPFTHWRPLPKGPKP